MLTINAEIRREQGKGAGRRLRLANKLPAIVYGGIEAPLAIKLDHETVLNLQTKEGFYSGDVLALVVDSTETKVKVQAVQRHPFKPKLMHIDFVRS
ncbi:50S ribosomal protein L25 [Candidatus Hoaglandella endobia]|uniref:Large ribosomal subunit protein bL25 n=1 Tax=Candidatus Hoaglandella endobia TaxID=1778263 RepID=A0A143WTN0_9ENTR|nr:50S ribosomal protein L25 [Candidatus Hoaglandella endobia]CUX97201.1 50S ribosomal protein L25 [Candidatus Hoaglandella endobia]